MSIAARFDDKSIPIAAVSTDGHQFHFDTHDMHPHGPASDAIVVPDAHLLFSGHYSRAGVDLILTGDNQKYVVHDYFKSDKRPALGSPEGATLSGAIIEALVGHAAYAENSDAPPATTTIGHVLKLSGTATAIRNGVTVQLGIGDAVMKGDVIQTGGDSSVGITFMDGSAFGMTSNARMVLNDMVYDPNGSSNSSLISLVQGTITFVAGQTAKNGNMKVETPVATMGIRGTAVLVEIAADDGPTKFSVLVEPDGHTGSYNLYDKVTGQMIGTVSQAGQVTFVTAVGSQDAISTLPKSLADQTSEKAIIQQVFQLYFPNYTPDQNANPKSIRGDGGSSSNNLAEVHNGVPITGSDQQQGAVSIKVPHIDPATGVTTYETILNVKAKFFTISETELQSGAGFLIKDHVVIVDPDIGNAPFFDVATPFLAGSGKVTSATTAIQLPAGYDEAYLERLISIDQTTGKVSFTSGAFNFLGKDETLTYTLTFISSSGPDSALQTLTFTVVGTNDAPIFTSAIAANVAEIGDHSPTNPAGGLPPQTGKADPISVNVAIPFTDADFTDVSAHYGVEITGVSASGVTAGLDANLNLRSFFSFTGITKVLDQTAGNITGLFSAADKTFDYLASGEQLTITYTLLLTNPAGATTPSSFTVTITGSNDVPVIETNSVTNTAVTETAGLTGGIVPGTVNAVPYTHSVSGTISFADVDLTDRPTITAPFSGFQYKDAAGHVITSTTSSFLTANQSADIVALETALSIVQANAHSGTATWTYNIADSALDFLAAGETLTLTYTATVNDQHGGTATTPVTVTITGTNDAPTVAVITNATLTETAGLTGGIVPGTTNSIPDTHSVSGTISFADVDLTDRPTITAPFSGFEYKDAAGHVITSTTSSFLTANQSADIVALETALSISQVNDHSGTATWTYNVADGSLDFLAAGETLTLTYTATANDQHGGVASRPITVVITGSNDVPTISTTSVTGAALSETAGLTNGIVPGSTGTVAATDTVGGTIIFADVDLTDRPAVTTAFTGFTYKDALNHDITITDQAASIAALEAVTLSLSATGTHNGSVAWSYSVPDSALDFLAAGETLTLTYTATVNDQHGGTATTPITVTITGSNDVPVFTLPAADHTTVVQSTTSDVTTLTATGSIGIADADHDQSSFQTTVTNVTSGNLGVLSINADGTFGYTVDNNAVRYLASGETKVETFQVKTLDGSAQTISFTIDGTNDKPTITVTNGASVVEQANTTADPVKIDSTQGTITFTDADLSDRPQVSTAYNSINGYSYFAANGTTALTLTALQETALAQALVLTLPTGTTNANNGSMDWTYSITDKALDFLADGEKLTLHYTATVDDQHGGTVTQPIDITIVGSNDVPVFTLPAADHITVVQSTTLAADTLTATGSIGIVDADHDQSSFQTASDVPTGNLGHFSINTDGSYTYTVDNNAVRYLSGDVNSPDHTKAETFQVKALDGTTQNVSFTIVGENDAPTIAASTPSAVLVQSDHHGNDGIVISTVSLTKADVDSGDTASFDTAGWTATSSASTYQLQGTFGTAELNTNTGVLTYHLDNNDPDTRALLAGAHVTDTFNIKVADTQGGAATQAVSFAIDGTVQPLHVGAGDGEFHTIQAAINAAHDGDTILVDAGTYAENLNIDKAVTILGAHAGQSGTDPSRSVTGDGETTIVGHEKITATTGSVMIDGVLFLNDGTTTHGGPNNPTLQIVSGEDHVVTDSIFYSTVAGGANGVADRAISLPSLSGGNITISDNYFTGDHNGSFSTASWGSAVWSDGGEHLSLTGNTFEFSRTALNLSVGGASQASVDQNVFHSDGSGISVGPTDNGQLSVTNNSFQNVDTDFNFQNLSSGFTFNAQAAVGHLTPTGTRTDPIVVLGGAGNDTLISSQFNDSLTGNGGADNFKFNANFGHDTITDFAQYSIAGSAHDTIDLSSFVTAANPADWISAHVAQNTVAGQTNDTLVTVDANNIITLHNVVAANLSINDFHLA